jgi:hypothetical protein
VYSRVMRAVLLRYTNSTECAARRSVQRPLQRNIELRCGSSLEDSDLRQEYMGLLLPRTHHKTASSPRNRYLTFSIYDSTINCTPTLSMMRFH